MDSKTLMIVGALMLAATGAYMAFNQDQAVDMATRFESFKSFHGRNYPTAEEEAYRFAVWAANIKMIEEHNADANQTYTMAENHFADITNDEFRAVYLGYTPKEQVEYFDLADEYHVGANINWVDRGAVQRVKDQGQCGSCWAFSTVAATESFEFTSQGTLGDFSEQQLVDCSTSYGNHGCRGGLMDFGFEYFRDHGICTEDTYPYTAKDGICQADTCTKSSFKISGYKDVRGVSGLTEALMQQPVSIAVDARKWSFYSSGIYSNCGTSLDHGVLLAGVTDSYWLVKNSWGSGWGENGYIRLASGNTCGLANQPSYPK